MLLSTGSNTYKPVVLENIKAIIMGKVRDFFSRVGSKIKSKASGAKSYLKSQKRFWRNDEGSFRKNLYGSTEASKAVKLKGMYSKGLESSKGRMGRARLIRDLAGEGTSQYQKFNRKFESAKKHYDRLSKNSDRLDRSLSTAGYDSDNLGRLGRVGGVFKKAGRGFAIFAGDIADKYVTGKANRVVDKYAGEVMAAYQSALTSAFRLYGDQLEGEELETVKKNLFEGAVDQVFGRTKRGGKILRKMDNNEKYNQAVRSALQSRANGREMWATAQGRSNFVDSLSPKTAAIYSGDVSSAYATTSYKAATKASG